MNARMGAAVLFGLFVGGWIGRAVFRWILDVPDPWQIAAIVACAIAGAVIGVAGEREERARR